MKIVTCMPVHNAVFQKYLIFLFQTQVSEPFQFKSFRNMPEIWSRIERLKLKQSTWSVFNNNLFSFLYTPIIMDCMMFSNIIIVRVCVINPLHMGRRFNHPCLFISNSLLLLSVIEISALCMYIYLQNNKGATTLLLVQCQNVFLLFIIMHVACKLSQLLAWPWLTEMIPIGEMISKLYIIGPFPICISCQGSETVKYIG